MAVLKVNAGSSSPITPDNKYGVWGQSDTGYGVEGTSATSSGVKGETATADYANAGVRGMAGWSGDPTDPQQANYPDLKCGVWGESDSGYGVFGSSAQTAGV
jgi:hypothetical protein